MAKERTINGDVSVEQLLAQLRRAAEQDGVDDVDAVVAQFATFVRAQAPRLAAQRTIRHGGMSWSSALLAVGALSVAVFGALVSGAVTNPFLPSSSGSTADDESADGIVGAGPEPLTIVVPDEIAPRNSVAGSLAEGDADGDGDGDGDAGADAVVMMIEATSAASMTFTDPDALAVMAEQRSEAPPPSTTAPAPPVSDPSPTIATSTPDAGSVAPSTTAPAAPVTDSSSVPETLSPHTDQGDAG